MEHDGGLTRHAAQHKVTEAFDQVRSQNDPSMCSPRQAAEMVMAFRQYISQWKAEKPDDLPSAPPLLPPPYRAEVWALWWEALECRNAKYA